MTAAAETGAPARAENAGRTHVLRKFVNPDNGETQEEIACPLCGKNDAEVLFQGSDLVFHRDGKYSVVRCRSCELQFTNPRPTFESLGAHYPENYFCYVPPEEGFPLFRPILRWFLTAIQRRRIAFLERTSGRLKPEAQVLDVGCGMNDLLYSMKQTRGVVGTGLDFKEEMVAFVRDRLKMPIIKGTLSTSGIPEGSYDVVTMMEYLEHESDPRKTLEEARRVMKKGAHLAIEVPDITGWPAKTFKNKWWNLDVPRHLVYFTPTTLSRMLDECGFEMVRVDPFTVPLYIGSSILLALGFKFDINDKFMGRFLASMLGFPFVFLQRWVPEFMFVVARAK
ncbi:MAG TPA: class I SAM-dependent methyltransferase [Polyangiaceae bacterium]|jgi:ubiquinone/menaquinone biosynthesis C-methylase UbiE|nr:class I SAM-dependent methyltransferase [Polyangiaceae bacterium]